MLWSLAHARKITTPLLSSGKSVIKHLINYLWGSEFKPFKIIPFKVSKCWSIAILAMAITAATVDFTPILINSWRQRVESWSLPLILTLELYVNDLTTFWTNKRDDINCYSFHYCQKSTTCKYSSTAVSAQVSTYGLVSPRNNTDAIMAALDTYGPLPAALMVFDNLYNYAYFFLYSLNTYWLRIKVIIIYLNIFTALVYTANHFVRGSTLMMSITPSSSSVTEPQQTLLPFLTGSFVIPGALDGVSVVISILEKESTCATSSLWLLSSASSKFWPRHIQRIEISPNTWPILLSTHLSMV